VEKEQFKFLDAYRLMVPSAASELIEARRKSHDKILPLASKDFKKVYDLCRLAFRLPNDTANFAEWFELPVKEFDVRFSIAIDSAETARISALLLRDLISRGTAHYSLLVLATSYCGRRAPEGGGALLKEAQIATVYAGKELAVVLAEKKVAVPAGKDLKTEFEAMAASFVAATAQAAMTILVNDVRGGMAKLATSANEAMTSLRNDAVRLADEVDMLWWHIGDWSDLLEKSRESLGAQATAIASGVELGSLVRQVPGPYGAYGILRRTTGKNSNEKTTLKKSIAAIDSTDLKLLARQLPTSALSIFPVHAALKLATENNAGAWATEFERQVPEVVDIEVSNYELAVQAFRERVTIEFGEFG